MKDQRARSGRASKLVVLMCMVIAMLTVTQATALAADDLVVKCTEKNGVVWQLATNDEERMHKAIADCVTAGGVAQVRTL